jgi:hypothetical protein
MRSVYYLQCMAVWAQSPSANRLTTVRQRHQIALLVARSNSDKPTTGYLGSRLWRLGLQSLGSGPAASFVIAAGSRPADRLSGSVHPRPRRSEGTGSLDSGEMTTVCDSTICPLRLCRHPQSAASSTPAEQGRPDGTSSQHQHSKQRHGTTTADVDWTLGFNLG